MSSNVPTLDDLRDEKWNDYWDGVARSYIPSPVLRVPEGLKLHTDVADTIDPATFEVIRFGLFNTNFEHNDVIQRTSASPIVVITRDFNTCLLTEDGEFVYFGSSLQYMAGQMDTSVRWCIENRGDEPGIHDGDMFLSNDPWVGCAHQQDVGLLCPVFHGDELFCWVTSTMHQTDIGGSTPGSFCVDAKDVYDEPSPMPPIKIVENDKIRRDVEGLYLRASRLPDTVALDLRGQINGARAARNRVTGLIERYGADVVKGSMKRILDNAERSFVERISSIPDGEWSERLYQEAAFDGDRRAHPICLTVKKEGDILTFSNEGTVLSEGILNLTFAGWQGGILAAIHAMLAYDQMGCLGGAQRHIRYNPTAGTATCAEHPSSVSAAGTYNTCFAVGMANGALVRMLSCGDQEARKAITASAWTLPGWCFAVAEDQHDGSFVVCPMCDGMAGAIGPYESRDGIDTAGFYHIPTGQANNVEDYEQIWPMLYLYRRFETQALEGDSALAWGWGTRRGGRSFVAGLVPWNTEQISMELHTEEAIPKQMGLFGGYLGSVNFHRYKPDSDVREQFANGSIPVNFGEVGGEAIYTSPKGLRYPLTSAGMWEWNSTSTGGYGDPLGRATADVAGDLDGGIIDRYTAEAVYGCVFAADGSVDEGATQTRRKEMAQGRLAGLNISSLGKVENGTSVGRALEHLKIVDSAEGRLFACDSCDENLGSTTENYKQKAAVVLTPVKDLPGFRDPAMHVDVLVEYRQFCCPGCGVIFDSEIAPSEDAFLHDVRIGG
ncbi:MAG: hydantoinase B/oxoprolinase family protein [Actinomycetota bacterium]